MYGKSGNSPFGKPAHSAYGKPAPAGYGKPAHGSYGKPAHRAYGQLVHPTTYGTVNGTQNTAPQQSQQNTPATPAAVRHNVYNRPTRTTLGTTPHAAAMPRNQVQPRPGLHQGRADTHPGSHFGYRKPETYAYKESKFQSDLTVAEPYYITKMMFQGLLERLAQARGAIDRNDLAVKATKLASATSIIEILKTSLDFSYKPSLAQNLSDLYDFMLDRLREASINLSSKPIDDAIKILLPIKSAWERIPIQAIEQANEMRHVDADYSNNASMLAAHV